MAIAVEHFDLTGRNALVLSAETPPGQAIAEAYAEAGARVTRLHTLSASEVAQAVKRAAADMGGLQILASAADRFLAKPVTAITAAELAEVMMANYAFQFYACQAGVEVMRQQGPGGNIVLVTHVLGERGLPNTSVYAAAHGAVHNLIRALAQEIAPTGSPSTASRWDGWSGCTTASTAPTRRPIAPCVFLSSSARALQRMWARSPCGSRARLSAT